MRILFIDGNPARRASMKLFCGSKKAFGFPAIMLKMIVKQDAICRNLMNEDYDYVCLGASTSTHFTPFDIMTFVTTNNLQGGSTFLIHSLDEKTTQEIIVGLTLNHYWCNDVSFKQLKKIIAEELKK